MVDMLQANGQVWTMDEPSRWIMPNELTSNEQWWCGCFDAIQQFGRVNELCVEAEKWAADIIAGQLRYTNPVDPLLVGVIPS